MIDDCIKLVSCSVTDSPAEPQSPSPEESRVRRPSTQIVLYTTLPNIKNCYQGLS